MVIMMIMMDGRTGEGLALHNSGWVNGWRLRRRVQLGSSGVSQSVSQSVSKSCEREHLAGLGWVIERRTTTAAI